MNKKLQVFVSSTYTDLIEERQAAVEAILDAGHIPAGMELFKAGKSQMQTIKKWIDESDVYMLILGGRYGSIEEESGLSYTELEYRYALSKNMPVFAIIINDSFLHAKASTSNTDKIFEKKNKSKYNSFKKYIKNNIVCFVDNIDQIFSKTQSQLNHICTSDEYELIGWVRYNDSNFTIIDTNNSHINSILKDFNIYLESLAVKLNDLLTHMYISRENNIHFTDDWNAFAHEIVNLHNFYSINKYYLESYNNELENIFLNYDKLVKILTNIINNQNRTPSHNDNKSLDILLNDLNKSLSKLICKFDYK